MALADGIWPPGLIRRASSRRGAGFHKVTNRILKALLVGFFKSSWALQALLRDRNRYAQRRPRRLAHRRQIR